MIVMLHVFQQCIIRLTTCTSASLLTCRLSRQACILVFSVAINVTHVIEDQDAFMSRKNQMHSYGSSIIWFPFIYCYRERHFVTISLHTYFKASMHTQFFVFFCFLQVVEILSFRMRGNNKQGNNNCIMQHVYHIIYWGYIFGCTK